jgi:hypothetical protein
MTRGVFIPGKDEFGCAFYRAFYMKVVEIWCSLFDPLYWKQFPSLLFLTFIFMIRSQHSTRLPPHSFKIV